MAEITGISWSDATCSPWTGCTKISPACDGCFAAHLMDTRMGRVTWGEPGVGEGTRSLMSDAYWRKPLTWDKQAKAAGTPLFVFPSLCDPFDTAVPPEWRWRFVELMEATPNLLWLLLTKRVGNVVKLTDPTRGERPLPPNHALGGTFCNQKEWDRDGLRLSEAAMFTEPRFTFASFEPLLGPIDFRGGWMPDWIIGGGETDQGAHKARPTHPDWARGLRDQAAAAGRLFHWKQWGEFVEIDGLRCRGGPVSRQDRGPGVFWLKPDGTRLELNDRMAPYCSVWGPDSIMKRVGKKVAGRLLDGVIHDARPEVKHG